jgi:hypothetical protein
MMDMDLDIVRRGASYLLHRLPPEALLLRGPWQKAHKIIRMSSNETFVAPQSVIDVGLIE